MGGEMIGMIVERDNENKNLVHEKKELEKRFG